MQAAAEMKQIYLVYIVVFRGQKHDTSDERHAGLLFASLENGLYYYFHLVDGSDGYVLEVKKGFDPRDSRGALPSVRVGKTAPLTPDQLVDSMKSAPVKTKEDEFSDRHWVHEALTVMVDAGYITQQAYDLGFNMVLQTLLDGSADEVPDLDWCKGRQRRRDVSRRHGRCERPAARAQASAAAGLTTAWIRRLLESFTLLLGCAGIFGVDGVPRPQAAPFLSLRDILTSRGAAEQAWHTDGI